MVDTWIEIPELYGAAAFFRLEKGLSHKYLKRVPTGNAKRPWRYYYKLSGGAGRLLNPEHMKTGASFADAAIGAHGGHWHIASEHDDNFTIKHDETGEERNVSHDDLSKLIATAHGEGLAKHAAEQAAKNAELVEETKQHGSDKQRKRVGLKTKAEESDERKALQAEADAKVDQDRKAKPEPVDTEHIAVLGGKIEAVGDHIFGDRKDLARMGRIESSKDLENMSYADAAAIVSKSKLIAPLKLEDAQAMGLSAGTTHLFMVLMSSIRAKPGDSKADRAAYVDEIRELQGAMSTVKTIAAFSWLMDEMRAHRRSAPKFSVVASVASEMREDGSIRSSMDVAQARIAQLKNDNPGVKYQTRTHYSSMTTEILVDGVRPYDALGDRFVNMLVRKRDTKAGQEMGDALFQAGRLDNTHDWGGGWHVSSAEKSAPVKGGMSPAEGWLWLAMSTIKDKKEVAEKAKPKEANTEKGHSTAKDFAGEVVRVGGTQVKDANADRTKNEFGLREVNYGKEGYMTQADRAYHTKALEESLHDMSDALGVDPKILSFNGRLGVELGASGKGAARAHYESGRYAINITKFRGGGSLAHEWGHALDNIVSSHFIKNDAGRSIGDTFLSHTPEHSSLPPEVSSKIQGVMKAMREHPDPVAARKSHAEKTAYLNREYERLLHENNALVREHKNLMRKPKAENSDMSIRHAEKRATDYRAEIARLEQKKPGKARDAELGAAHHWIGKHEASIKALRAGEGFATPADADRIKEIESQVEKMRAPMNRSRDELRLQKKLSPTSSAFNATSQGMGEDYWGSPHEMFARAFESYVSDKLKNAGRRNTYLVDHREKETSEAYPQGDERKAINHAFDGLMGVLKSSGHLTKAFSAHAERMAMIEAAMSGWKVDA